MAAPRDDEGAARDSSAPEVVPAPPSALVRACAHDAWAPAFRAHAFRSEAIDLPQEFVAYLLADGVQLRSDSAALPTRTAADPFSGDDSAFTPADEATDSEEEAAAPPRFEALEAEIDAAIARLGGAVLPKLNWSSPKDAVWLTVDGSLRCSNAAEVVLLLKSSDAVAHDLCHAYGACGDGAPPPTPPQLVLKQWAALRPSAEFRCFARRGRLVGVCQRHTGEHFPFLHEQRGELARTLDAFHDEHVAAAFPHDDYTYDVYVMSSGRVRVIDFNPWGGATLPLLFTWRELARIDEAEGEGDAEDLPAMRVVDSPLGIRPGLRTGVPLELYDTSAGSALQDFIARHRDDAVRGGED